LRKLTPQIPSLSLCLWEASIYNFNVAAWWRTGFGPAV
jgi:hypothetical protein